MKKYIFALAVAVCAAVSAALPEEIVVSSAPGGLFKENEEIIFKNTGVRQFSFEVIAFPYGNKFGSGIIRSGESLKLMSLPRGYYCLMDVKDPDFSVRFAVVPDPDRNPNNPDSFFALDGALSSLVSLKNEEKAVEIARRSGTRFIRERGPRFGRVEKEKDVFDYSDPFRQIKRFHDAGIKILSMYHSAPAWSRPERPSNTMPDDLFALYDFSRRTAEKFQKFCPAFEFWNETDYICPDSVWDYASALKAASLGWKAGSKDALVMNGGFAINPGEQKYHHILMRNGISEYLDVISLHFYGGIPQLQKIMERNLEFLDRYHAGHLKIWYTETGCRAEGKGKVQFRESRNLKEHAFDQEMTVSEFLVKQMTTLHFYGADRNCFFSIFPCNEEKGAKVWGLTRRDTLQVKAGLAAFTALNGNLSYAKPLGQIKGLSNITGFLYEQKDGSFTALLWRIPGKNTGTHEGNSAFDNIREPFTLPAENRILSAQNIFGSPIKVKNNTIPLGRFPVYLSLKKKLDVIPAKIRRKTSPPAGVSDKTIVFQAIFSPSLEVVQEDGPWKSRPSQLARFKAPSAKIKFYVCNFSDMEKRGTIQVKGCRAAGSPEKEFCIDPMSKKMFVIELAPQQEQGVIEFSGNFNGKPATPLVIPFSALRETPVQNK